MVRVCDAIMGTGKSSAAITYINEHPERRFIYITPYLEEAARIKQNCPDANFIEPSSKLAKFQYKKSVHTAALIKEGRNIATTHQAFKGYDSSMLDGIRERGYTLIIDENVEILEEFAIHEDDLQMAVDAGYIREEDNSYVLANETYSGTALRELFRMIRSRKLFKMPKEIAGDYAALFYWILPSELILAFDDVFILTYLFQGQSIRYFLEMYSIPYEFIGIQKDDSGYRFCDPPGYMPEYVTTLKDKIHILDHEKINEVGEDYHALSKSWFERDGEDVEQLRKNMNNYYKHICGDTSADRRLWGTFKDAFTKVRGKGYTKGFLPFNTKATNKYRDRDILSYPVNIFMNVNEKLFYQTNGIEVDEDLYSLSVMVQWIWRSAIRDGKEIWIYIPSRRMRELLMNWIDSFSKGGTADE